MTTLHNLSAEPVSFTLSVLKGGGQYALRGILHAEVEQSSRAAVMMLALVMRSGERMDNPLGWPISRELGRGYRYLPRATIGAISFTTELLLPTDTAFVEATFRAWRPVGGISLGGIRLDILRRSLGAPPPRSVDVPPLAAEAPRHRVVLAGQSVMAPVSYDVEAGCTYVLSVGAAAEGSPAQAFLLQPQFDQIDGSPAKATPKGFGRSPRFGHFAYLDAGESSLRFTAPAEARQLRFNLHPWSARKGEVELATKLRLFGMPEQAVQAQIRQELEALFADADPDSPFLCIYTGTKRIGEGNRANRSMMFAREAARLGFTTVYTYSAAEGETDFRRTNERLLQVPLSAFGHIAGIVAQRAPGRARMLLGSMPDVELCRNIGLFRHHGWTYVYECRDEWEEFAAVGSAGWFDEAFERFATEQASKVFCVSPPLQAKMRRYTTEPGKVLVSPNATTDEFLINSRSLRPLALARHAKAPPARPRIGYFGHLTEQWFDWGALLRAANLLPHVQFDIIGFDMPQIELAPNVAYLGSKTHEEIIAIAQEWDVGLIPFKPGRLSRAVDPIKVYEYLALGMKVVSVPMGSLETFPLTFCYEEFGLPEALAKAIAHRPTDAEWEKVDAILSHASWRWRLLDLLKESGISPTEGKQADAA